MIQAKKGSYVVKTPDTWVYDVEMYDEEILVAVVGFTERQKEGAVFWQLRPEKCIQYDCDMIKCLARNYFLTNR